jgi:multicomponent Na+:H+ antiporter subunit D
LLFSALAFFLLLPLMRRTETLSLDVDWLYRRLLPRLSAQTEHGAKALGAVTRAKSDTFAHAMDRAGQRLQKRRAGWPVTTIQFLAVSILLALFLLMPAFAF